MLIIFIIVHCLGFCYFSKVRTIVNLQPVSGIAQPLNGAENK